MDLSDFHRFEFTAGDITKTVYRKGNGPGILLMHELPGMVPECVELARAIAAAEYTVYMPLLFGAAGERLGLPQMVKVCVSQEFQALRSGVKRPIADWLRSLSVDRIQAERPGPSGAIGMCLTGGFVLGLLLDEHMVAPVSCQPSLPLAIPIIHGRARRLDLDLNPQDLAKVKARSDVPILGLRFEGDGICPREKFQAMRREFGDRFLEKQLPGDHHSTLTIDFAEMSLDDQDWTWRTLFDFLNQRLKSGAGRIPPKPANP